MGCTNSTDIVPPIPEPSGKPTDLLCAEGDLVSLITHDPHIHFYQKKLQEVILPVKRSTEQSKKQQASQKSLKTDKSSNMRTNVLNIEKYATADRKQFEAYTETVNAALKGNDASVTNILAYMIEEIADVREGRTAENKFKNDAYAALKCFVYLYTGHYSYVNINKELRKNQYEKISRVVAVVQKQLEEYNKERFARKLKANIKIGKILDLFRGIPKPDKSIQKGERLYWKAFTSTSLSTSIAARFGRYTYVISLDTSCPHPYMIVPEELSQFKEEEIILFPYFYFEVVQIDPFANGAKYVCKQINPD